MKQVFPDNLVVALEKFQAEERQAGRLGFEPVSPVVQKSTWEPKFLRAHPVEILESGTQMDVPLMMGSTLNDGTFPLGVLYNRFLNCPTCGALQNNATFLKNDLTYRILRSMGVIDNTHAVYHTLGSKFLGEAAQSGNFTQMTPGLTDLNSVFFFKAGAYRNLLLHSRKNSNSYWYSFDHKGQYSLFALFFPYPPPPIPGGVAHSDDLLYLFHFFSLNAADQSLSYGMIDYWMNFVYNGNPNVAAPNTRKSSSPKAPVIWPAFSERDTKYLIINNGFEVGDDYMGNWGGNHC
jgi:carboxylesterase type B